MTIDDLRKEFEAYRVGPNLMAMLSKIVRAVAPKYPAAVYTESGNWRSELEDVRQEWIAERLLVRRGKDGEERSGGELAQISATASTMRSFEALLTRSFHRHLTDRPERVLGNRPGQAELRNLHGRVKKSLESGGAFVKVGSPARRPGEQYWALKARPCTQPSPHSVRHLTGVAHERTDVEWDVVRYGPDARKASPILTEPKLREFVHMLLDRAEGALRLDAILEVLRDRFDLGFGVDSLDAKGDEDGPAPEVPVPLREFATPERQVILGEIARSIVARLDHVQLRILRAYEAAEWNYSSAERQLGIHRATVKRVVEKTLETMRELTDTDEEFVQVYQLVMEWLFADE